MYATIKNVYLVKRVWIFSHSWYCQTYRILCWYCTQLEGWPKSAPTHM